MSDKAATRSGPWVSLAIFHDPDEALPNNTAPIPGRIMTVTLDDLPAMVSLGFVFSAFGFSEDPGTRISLDLRWFGPDGTSLATTPIAMTIHAGWQGGMATTRVGLPFPQMGLYWLAVVYGDRELTRTPLLAALRASIPFPQA